ncbi:MAG: hypothetical protein WBX38_07080 [Candidatus Sulfotelmatobacter sp.]
MKTYAHSRTVIALAASLLSVGLPSVLAAQAGDVAADAEAQARQAWRLTMHHAGISETGCFHASYPNTQWEKVECAPAPSHRSVPPKRTADDSAARAGAQTTGNLYDYVAQAPAGEFFSFALGSFPTVTGVTSEKTVNVLFGGYLSDGIPGPNEYTLQINSNYAYGTSACAGYSYCQSWQQYFVQTNSAGAPQEVAGSQGSAKLTNQTSVAIESWLLNYGVHNGSDICPAPYQDYEPDYYGPGDDCVRNSPLTVMYNGQIPITELASLQLSGTAVTNGKDVATATYGTEAYAATVNDSITGIAGAWNQVEFNVFGNQNGAQAVFNKGASLTLNIALDYGSTEVPTCIYPSYYNGTTGETNNLNLGTTCTLAGGASPYIQFTESD